MFGGLREVLFVLESCCCARLVPGQLCSKQAKALAFGQSSLLDVAEIIQTTLSLGS